MNKIKIISSSTEHDFTDMINTWLRDNKNIKLIDIKYTVIVKPPSLSYVNTGSTYYSAMIIYEKCLLSDDNTIDKQRKWVEKCVKKQIKGQLLDIRGYIDNSIRESLKDIREIYSSFIDLNKNDNK